MKWLLFYLLLGSLLVGCANNPYPRTTIGAVGGAAAGAVIGNAINDDSGPWVGAAVGALSGAALGNYMDRQQQAFEQALAAEQQRHNIEIQRRGDGTLLVQIPNEVGFDFDSDRVRSEFGPILDKTAGVLNQYPDTRITVAGHTDSLGAADYNLDLSRRRARNVADQLALRNVAPQRLATVGLGETQPRASNASPPGRQLNRRVELILDATTAPGNPAPAPVPNAGNAPPPYGGYRPPPPPPPRS